jgi:general secretion pathway protein D
MKLHHVAALGLLLSMPAWAMAEEPAKSAGGGGIEMSELIERFAKRSGKQFVIDPRVQARVPLAGIDASQINYAQLLTILDVHGFAVAEVGGLLAVIPDANARQIPVPTYTDTRFKAADGELVTLLQQMKKTCAAHLVPVLRPLMPQAAHLAAAVQTNTLIINGKAAEVRRIANLAQELDSRGNSESPNCELARKSD